MFNSPEARHEFDLWTAVWLIVSQRQQMSAREGGWQLRFAALPCITLKTAVARSKRELCAHPSCLAFQPEEKLVAQVDLRIANKSSPVFFGEWGTKLHPPTIKIFKRGDWEDQVLAVEENVIRDLEKYAGRPMPRRRW